MKKRTIALIMAMCIVLGGAVGGAIAWLMDTTEKVTNTFTVGEVKIDLWETKDQEKVTERAYDYVPGDELAKDPTVEVLAGSENCWVFVIVLETDPDNILNWTVDSAWEKLPGYTNVYYQENVAAETQLNVIANQKVTIDTKANGDETAPELSFVAAAIQYEHIDTAADAFNALPTEFKGQAA